MTRTGKAFAVIQRLALLLIAALLAPGCGGDDDTQCGSLEIGVRNVDTDEFEPLGENGLVRVWLGTISFSANLSLRATEIDPTAPAPSVTISVDEGVVIAIAGSWPDDMEAVAPAYVLWDLRLLFGAPLCCYICKQAVVTARLEDATGKCFEGSVTAQLVRNQCPDESACCDDATSCPSGITMVPICEG